MEEKTAARGFTLRRAVTVGGTGRTHSGVTGCCAGLCAVFLPGRGAALGRNEAAIQPTALHRRRRRRRRSRLFVVTAAVVGRGGVSCASADRSVRPLPSPLAAARSTAGGVCEKATLSKAVSTSGSRVSVTVRSTSKDHRRRRCCRHRLEHDGGGGGVRESGRPVGGGQTRQRSASIQGSGQTSANRQRSVLVPHRQRRTGARCVTVWYDSARA